MKVCYVSPFYPESVSSPDEMMAAWPLLRYLPPALRMEGHEVVVLAHAARAGVRTIDGVRYRFIDPGPVAKRVGRQFHRWKPRYGAAYYLPATRLCWALRDERPDVVHFSGLTLDLLLAQVALVCSRLSAPLVVHFHGGEPDRGRLRRLQRFNLSRIDRLLVTTGEQAIPWVAAGLLEADRITQVVESSSPFSGIERSAARAQTGMRGDPIYLSAGRLDAIKDPMTMMRGFEQIAAGQPDARLYLYYLSAELLPEIEAFLRDRPAIAGRVELRGRARLEEMEGIYSSADVLLQASLREWSGLAVIEAMSCGCVPIVSDIPSFRMLTSDGRYGRLFTVGDAAGLAEASLSMTARERADLSNAAREHFTRQLSFDAMARRISAVYCELVSQRDI